MDAGARIDLKDTQGKTPWRAALTKNHQAVAKILRTSMRGRFEAEEGAMIVFFVFFIVGPSLDHRWTIVVLFTIVLPILLFYLKDI
jgi:hypothetical protein